MAIDFTGRRFGNYVATKLLGEGGFGAVYLAEHPFVSRKAAVKVLHPMMAHDPELLGRFFNEARAATAIRHQNIIEIFDAGTAEDGTPYLLMELLDGESLKDRISRAGRLPLDTVLKFSVEAASALHAAHQAGIVHRDLKPENMFVVPVPGKPSQEQIKILDFGIAKLSGPIANRNSVKTQIGQFMGSPAYMSPEQWNASPDIDHRTDIYSLGAIVFEMLAGRAPFESPIPFALRDMHLVHPVPVLADLGVQVPAHVEAVIRKAMAKAPADRYNDIADMAAALAGRQSAPVLGAIPPTPATIPPRTASSMAMQAPRASTTMSSNTGERATAKAQDEGDDLQPPTRRTGLFVVGGLIAAAAVAGGIFFTRKPTGPGTGGAIHDAEKKPLAGETTGTTAGTTTGAGTNPTGTGTATTTKPPAGGEAAGHKAPPPELTISVRINSEPPGASVLDASGKVIGKTPFVKSYPVGQQPARLRLLKKGFKLQQVDVPAGGDLDKTVPLEKAAPVGGEGDVVL